MMKNVDFPLLLFSNVENKYSIFIYLKQMLHYTYYSLYQAKCSQNGIQFFVLSNRQRIEV